MNITFIARYGTIFGASHIGVIFKVESNELEAIESHLKCLFAPLRFNDRDTEVFLKNIVSYEVYDSDKYTTMKNIIPQVIKVSE